MILNAVSYKAPLNWIVTLWYGGAIRLRCWRCLKCKYRCEQTQTSTPPPQRSPYIRLIQPFSPASSFGLKKLVNLFMLVVLTFFKA